MNTRQKVNLYRRLLRKAQTELRTAVMSRDEFEEMIQKGVIPDGVVSYEEYLDAPDDVEMLLMESPPQDDEPEPSNNNEWRTKAEDLVAEHSPVNIPHFAYRGDLDENWAYVVGHHRDSETWEQSNYQVIQQDLERRFPEDVVEEESSHFLVGWSTGLAVRIFDNRGYVTDAGVAALEWLDKLENYSIADEDHWSEMQYQLAGEYIDQDIRYILEHDDDFGEELTDEDVSAVYEWLRENEDHAIRYVEEHPEQHGLEGNYNDEVKDAGRAVGLDQFSRNQQAIQQGLGQLVSRQQDLSAEDAAKIVFDQLDLSGDYTFEQVWELADQLVAAPDPRQQELL